jgi:hypothetical protein
MSIFKMMSAENNTINQEIDRGLPKGSIGTFKMMTCQPYPEQNYDELKTQDSLGRSSRLERFADLPDFLLNKIAEIYAPRPDFVQELKHLFKFLEDYQRNMEEIHTLHNHPHARLRAFESAKCFDLEDIPPALVRLTRGRRQAYARFKTFHINGKSYQAVKKHTVGVLQYVNTEYSVDNGEWDMGGHVVGALEYFREDKLSHPDFDGDWITPNTASSRVRLGLDRGVEDNLSVQILKNAYRCAQHTYLRGINKIFKSTRKVMLWKYIVYTSKMRDEGWVEMETDQNGGSFQSRRRFQKWGKNPTNLPFTEWRRIESIKGVWGLGRMGRVAPAKGW